MIILTAVIIKESYNFDNIQVYLNFRRFRFPVITQYLKHKKENSFISKLKVLLKPFTHLQGP